MLIIVTFLIILSRFPYSVSDLDACVPSTHFVVNNKICRCNQQGQWSESDCGKLQDHRQSCTSGQIIEEKCSKCICQQNGQFSCTDKLCQEPIITTNQNFKTATPWCTPFKSYYIDCNICHCTASGLLTEAHCVKDPMCTLNVQPPFSDPNTKLSCIPKVMYLFTCMHCLCSDEGFFKKKKCVETCPNNERSISDKCIPKSFYRKNCNLCRCSDSGVPDDRLCSKADCNETKLPMNYLEALRVKPSKCVPHKFVKPRCLYCDCNSAGSIDKSACLELGCVPDFKYNVERTNCSQGETVPYCIECFCLKNGHTSSKYCSKSCTYENKLNVLESVIKDSITDNSLIDRLAIEQKGSKESCEPGSIYSDFGRYCLCPDNGYTNFNLCTALQEIETTTKMPDITALKLPEYNYSITCEPNTFIEFDCNTCLCNKKGEVDKIWCTRDDCDSKRKIQESHVYTKNIEPALSENCFPGSITRLQCNFCLCPDSGLVKELVCTKNDCTNFVLPPDSDKFTCEPLAYYEVDCNICFCPKDGLKNVAKCTKNHCERSYLRSDVCVPGQLFSDECNVCICPPNGNTSEKACTNYTCSEPTHWKKIFQISENLLGQTPEDSTRNLELCFPGEEFVVGCKLCLCPDMGLREYATCSPMLCDDTVSDDIAPNTTIEQSTIAVTTIETPPSLIQSSPPKTVVHYRRDDEDCMIYNMTTDEFKGRSECNPGSMYIIKCKECICPYMGAIIQFCRPLPAGTYCEQAYPGYNFEPAGRRDVLINKTANKQQLETEVIENISEKTKYVFMKHRHTKYLCSELGRVLDQCFICDCIKSNGTMYIIEEHCYKSNATECEAASPGFFNKLIN